MTTARKETIFPSKREFADISQIDVRVGVVFDSSLAVALAPQRTIKQMQSVKAIQSVAGRNMGRGRFRTGDQYVTPKGSQSFTTNPIT
jgi:hypothetical protein